MDDLKYNNCLYINKIVTESIVDGPGLRYVIHVQSCNRKCDGCINPDAHDYSNGYCKSVISASSEIMSNPKIHGVTFTGGEPLFNNTHRALLKLTNMLKSSNHFLNFILYTGYTMGEINDMISLAKKVDDHTLGNFISSMDFVVDGCFVKHLVDDSLEFRGSKNQNIYAIHRNRIDLQNPCVDNDWSTYSELRKR